jgi:sugar lactone lactonase YvrE
MPGTDGSVADAADGGDGAVLPTCIGNPLTADGGTLDGGVDLDAAVTTQIVTVPAGIFLDGPQWLDANGGFLVFSEFDPTARLQRVAADGGALGTFRDAGFGANLGPVGNALRDGLVISAVDHKAGVATSAFFLTAPDGGPAGVLGLGDAGSSSPNDLVAGPNGNMYFTDGQYVDTTGFTGLYRLAADGGVQVIQQNFGRANGIALSPDNTKLYVGIGPISVGETDPKAVLVYNVSATGVVTAPAAGTSFILAADLVDVPDGIAVDVGGNLWIAEAAANGSANGRIEIFSAAKKKLGTIPFPGQRPTGVAFGGPDGKKLFITTEASTSGGGSAGVFTYASRCAGVK